MVRRAGSDGQTVETHFPTVRGHWDSYYRNIAEYLERTFSPGRDRRTSPRSRPRCSRPRPSRQNHARSPCHGRMWANVGDHPRPQISSNRHQPDYRSQLGPQAIHYTDERSRSRILRFMSVANRARRVSLNEGHGLRIRWSCTSELASRSRGATFTSETSGGVSSMTRHSMNRSRRSPSDD